MTWRRALSIWFIGLIILFLLGWWWAATNIQNSLTNRAEEALSAGGFSGINVAFDGCDAHLTGAGTAADAAAAEVAVENLDGVRLARSDLATPETAAAPSTTQAPSTTEAPAAEPAEITSTYEDGEIVLEGTVADEDARQALVDQAGRTVGPDNVTDNLTIDPAVTMAGAALILVGELPDEATRDGVRDDATEVAAESDLEIDDRLTVAAPSLADQLNELVAIDPIEFDTSSANIRSSSIPLLDQAVEVLTDNPEGAVEIGGHTDSDGGAADNLALSQARSEAVRTYLIDNGVDADRLEAAGYGEDQPVVANDTAENKQRNRRIEFTLL